MWTGTRLTEDDRAYVAAFLKAHRAILGLDAPGAVERRDEAREIYFSQVTAAGVAGSVRVSRFWKVVRIQGHMWPGLPLPEGWLSEDVLEAKLRALDSSEDLFARGYQYVWIRSPNNGSLELHEAACASTQRDVLWVDPVGAPRRARPSRPCVDARTGGALTPHCWSVTTERAPSGGQTRTTTTRTLRPCDELQP